VAVKYSYNKGEFQERMNAKYDVVATATSVNLKQRARNNIAVAGFGRKWQDTLKVDVYPREGNKSARPAVYLHHKIPYSDVFESGATIRGDQYLWL
jgi:hypothetical protein